MCVIYIVLWRKTRSCISKTLSWLHSCEVKIRKHFFLNLFVLRKTLSGLDLQHNFKIFWILRFKLQYEKIHFKSSPTYMIFWMYIDISTWLLSKTLIWIATEFLHSYNSLKHVLSISWFEISFQCLIEFLGMIKSTFTAGCFLWIEFEGSKMHYYKRHTTLNANAMFVLIFNAYTFKQIPNGSSKYTCMGPYRFRNIWFVLPLFATWYNLDRCLSPSHAFHYILHQLIHQ